MRVLVKVSCAMQKGCIQSVLHSINAQSWMRLQVILSTSCRVFYDFVAHTIFIQTLSKKLVHYIGCEIPAVHWQLHLDVALQMAAPQLSLKCRGEIYICDGVLLVIVL